MTQNIHVLSIAAALLALLFISLSILVIMRRRQMKIYFKDGQDAVLLRRLRAHANFAEYTPIALFLMWMTVVSQIPPLVFLITVSLFVFGRFLHSFGILGDSKSRQVMGRTIGTALTLLTMLFWAIYLLIASLL